MGLGKGERQEMCTTNGDSNLNSVRPSLHQRLFPICTCLPARWPGLHITYVQLTSILQGTRLVEVEASRICTTLSLVLMADFQTLQMTAYVRNGPVSAGRAS